MSIFKETFPKFVRDQLEQREKIISSGANKKGDKFSFNSGKGRSDEFYTYTLNKQCVLRLSSGVDITDPKIISEALGGAATARNFVLEGGVKSADGDNRGGFVERFGSSALGAGYAYGDANTRNSFFSGCSTLK